MQPILPTWFKYRQGAAAPAGENVLKLTAPNIPEAFIAMRAGRNGTFQGIFRTSADGPDIAETHEYPNEGDAWSAAFELYRNQVVTGMPTS